MKRYIKIMMIAGVSILTLAMLSCKDNDENTGPVVGKPAVGVVTPESDAIGIARLFEGDLMVAYGFNLDGVEAVYFNDTKAEITKQEIKKLEFAAPLLAELGQDDLPQEVSFRVTYLDAKGEEKNIYTLPIYITVPVSDASVVSVDAPALATVGSKVKVTGRNLDKVNSILLSDGTNKVTISKGDITVVDNQTIEFTVPVVSSTASELDYSVTVVWGDDNQEITPETGIKLLFPVVDQMPTQAVDAAIGDEIALTGKNLSLITKMMFDTHELLLIAIDEENMMFKIPAAGIEGVTPSPVVGNIVAMYGDPAQEIKIYDGFKISTTPTGVQAPTMTSMTPEDGGVSNDKYYLLKKVTVVGTNLENVEGVTVDGVAATIEFQSTTQIVFIVPKGVSFTTAKDVAVKVSYDSGQEISFGDVKVYPFYFWTNITIGSQDESNRGRVFFDFENGKVYTTDEYGAGDLDPYGFANTSTTSTFTDLLRTMAEANGINTAVVTETMYNSVDPYIFMTTSSKSEVSINGPGNSLSQLKNHRKSDGSHFAGSGDYYTGTPVVMFRILLSGSEAANKAAAIDGTFESLTDLTIPTYVGSGAPKYNGTPTSSAFTEGEVVMVQHASYAKTTSAIKMDATNTLKSGFMVIKTITDVNGVAAGANTSTITFDCYWPAHANVLP